MIVRTSRLKLGVERCRVVVRMPVILVPSKDDLVRQYTCSWTINRAD